MRAAIDLHIHSALSPCSDNDMTPNNIVNMAIIKGLDIIAVTDHNSAGNIESVQKAAEGKGLVVVPGMEIETVEEVHVLCLFRSLGAALKMQEIVYSALPGLMNREEIFGQQLLMDEEDNIIGNVNQLLVTAASLSIEEVYTKVQTLNGIIIPAHIDRQSYSVLSNLGIIPEELNVKYVELSKSCDKEEFLQKNPLISKYNFIKSSDAHNLGDLLERESFIELDNLCVDALIDAIKLK